jgi:hypothetical protein
LIRAELVLVNGERLSIALAEHSGSIGNALGRLDDWIQTEDGAWVQKSFIVEVRSLDGEPSRGEREGARTALRSGDVER